MKGIILKIINNKTIILTNMGDYKEVYINDQQQVRIGEEIEFHWYDTMVNHLFAWIQIKPRVAMSMLALLVAVLIPTYMLMQSSQVAGYVNIDINPSLQLTYNTKFKVVEVKGLNKDGKNLLESLDLNKMKLEEAIEKVVAEAIANNFISNEKDNGIIITTTELKNTIDADFMKMRLLEQINSFKSINLIILSCDQMDFDDAQAQQKSPGELLLKRYILAKAKNQIIDDSVSTYELIEQYNAVEISNHKDSKEDKIESNEEDNKSREQDNSDDAEQKNSEENNSDDSKGENSDIDHSDKENSERDNIDKESSDKHNSYQDSPERHDSDKNISEEDKLKRDDSDRIDSDQREQEHDKSDKDRDRNDSDEENESEKDN